MHYRPTGMLTKVQTSTVAGALSAILIWLLETYGRVDMPDYIAAAVTTIIMALVAYVTPLLPGEVEPVPHQPGMLAVERRREGDFVDVRPGKFQARDE